MIIARFGSTWAGAYVLPNGMMIDEYGTDRPSIANRVGGLDGDFDYLGDDANPIAPVRVRKTAIVSATSWTGVETALDTMRSALAGAESLLWGLCRDGSHRWAYAKCVSIGEPDRTGQYLHCPIEIEFMLSEGLWYSETLHTLHVNDGTSTVLANAGNIRAGLVAETGGTAGLTATSLNNTTNGSGWSVNLAAVAGYGITVDPAAYDIIDFYGVTDFFPLLTINVPSQLWLTLDPGNNTLVTASTGGTANGWDFSWYDTWVM